MGSHTNTPTTLDALLARRTLTIALLDHNPASTRAGHDLLLGVAVTSALRPTYKPSFHAAISLYEKTYFKYNAFQVPECPHARHAQP